MRIVYLLTAVVLLDSIVHHPLVWLASVAVLVTARLCYPAPKLLSGPVAEKKPLLTWKEIA